MTNLALFALMSLIWGFTWAAVKIGLADLPPVFLAAVRYLAAAAIMLVAVSGVLAVLSGTRWKRVLLTGALINTATYAFLYWGMQSVPSGLSGVINLSIIPVVLFLGAVATGEEVPHWRHAGALVLGLIGLATLFAPRIASQASGDALGIAAVVVGTLTFCAGSILSRPLLDESSPLAVTGAQAIVGAFLLSAISFLLEPIGSATIRALAKPSALASLAFLVIFGTIVGFAIFLRLMRDWGAARASLYGLVSPVVALFVGWLLFSEWVGWIEIMGSVLLLSAAAISLLGAAGGKAPGRAKG
jgi:drug/metabolite transporter (DMT)-like permease